MRSWISLLAIVVAIRSVAMPTIAAQTKAASQIQGGQQVVFEGQNSVCVCGSFVLPAPPDPLFQIDGQPAASGWTQGRVDLTMPGLKPGSYTITSTSRLVSGSHTFDVVAPTLTVTPTKLRRGQRGLLNLTLVGTTRSLLGVLRNESPDTIRMEPANQVDGSTSGGNPNTFDPPVTVIGGPNLGPFKVGATIRGATCPCGSGTMTGGPGAGGDVVDPPPIGSTPRPTPPTAPIGLLLERTDENWIPAPEPPAAGCTGQIGSKQTGLRAQIYQLGPGGWVPSTVTRPISIWLASRSRESGKALNAANPLDSPAAPDLYFDPADNPSLDCQGTGPWTAYPNRCHTKTPVSSSTVTMTTTDFGAFGDADASCPGCLRLVNRAGVISTTDDPPEPPSDEHYPVGAGRSIRLVSVPRDDTNHNGIADAYALERLDASEDEDAKPESKVSGDGLTAYEEYRGFFVAGCHTRTDPDRKDFFVYNPDGFDLTLFENASELAVRKILGNEWSGTSGRVVNFNRGVSSIVEQHGVWLKDAPAPTLANWWNGGGLDGYSSGTGIGIGSGDTIGWEGIGPPKNVQEVRVNRSAIVARNGATWPPPSSMSPGDPTHLTTLDLLETVAHELGHASGMRHHGDIAVSHAEVFAPGSGRNFNAPTPQGPYPTVRFNASTLLGQTLDPLTGTSFSTGHKGDEGSGDPTCIMAYQDHGSIVIDPLSPGGVCDATRPRRDQAFPRSNPYVTPRNPYLTYLTGGRDHFCISSAGTGMNAGGRCHGDAQRGNCKSQIHISDAK